MDEKIESDYKLHECLNLPKVGVQEIYDAQLNQPKKTWRLDIFREANEEDLEENHYLETVGEFIWSTSIEVDFCPYCGKHLYEDIPLKVEEIGQYVHCNYSGSCAKFSSSLSISPGIALE
ncbi:MAG: hypothetical protein HKP12_01915 [Gammaproteobacteria bacterium]|nr:hypothetical protein [Gammaproteobacteria bacterium]